MARSSREMVEGAAVVWARASGSARVGSARVSRIAAATFLLEGDMVELQGLGWCRVRGWSGVGRAREFRVSASVFSPKSGDRCVRPHELESSSLFAAASLQFDIDVDQRNRGWRDAGDAGGVAEGAGADFQELLLHFAREAADGAVVEPVGNGSLLGLLETVDGALLLAEVAGVLDFGLHG